MDVKDAIEKRRAYRSLESVSISDEIIEELLRAASLSPSCFNNQPWRFVFVRDNKILQEVFKGMSHGNEWTWDASMVIAVFSKKELDCSIHGRDYYLFDTGMATAFLILRATEMGLVAHPIAGYHENEVKSVLGIPDDYTLITLVIVGKHSSQLKKSLSEKQARDEKVRPERKELNQIGFLNLYSGG